MEQKEKEKAGCATYNWAITVYFILQNEENTLVKITLETHTHIQTFLTGVFFLLRLWQLLHFFFFSQ